MLARVAAIVALACAAWVPLGARRQTAPTQFRSGTRTVPVYVTVADGAGGFLLNLTKDDFEVRDDGKVQPITQFTTDAQPLSVVLLIDGSTSMWDVFKGVLEAANSFVLRMLPADRVAIASFSDRFQMRQNFTSDRDVLLAHLRAEDNIRMGVESRVYEGLDDAVLAVQKEPGRRIVLLISDGKQWAERPNTSAVTARSVITRALTRDVMIYTIPMWTRYMSLDDPPSRTIGRLAAETGGGSYEMREGDNVGAIFTQVALDLHQQYLIGFVPQTLDGKTHKLEVKVKRTQPGLKLRYRPSYVASPDTGPGGPPHL